MKRFGGVLHAFLLALMALALPAAVLAQELVVNATAGFGGYYRPGNWCPVTVTIHNNPKDAKPGDADYDFDGRVIVESESYTGRRGAYKFERAVDVPVTSRKRYTLFAKFRENPLNQPTLQVRTAAGRLVQSVPLDVQPLGKGQTLLVTVSDQARDLSFPFPRLAAVNFTYRAALPAEALPTHWAGYDAIDMLVFPGWPEGKITSDVEDAILEWVSMGGTVMFLGGANSGTYDAHGDSPLMAASVSSSSPYVPNVAGFAKAPEGANMVETRAVLLSAARANPGAEVLLKATDGTPIMVRKQHGKGQILFLGIDLETRSVEVRDALAPYWTAIVPLRNVVDWEYDLFDQLGKTRLVTGRAARPPNVVIVILICVLYTVIVGPVNFTILSRRNAVQFAWLTVPVIVLLFSGMIYAIGSLTKGGKSIAREISILESVQGQRHFAERSTLSVFVPSSGDYRALPLEDRFAIADGDRWHEVESVREAYDTFTTADAVTGSAGGIGFGASNPVVETTDASIRAASWPLRTFDTTQFEMRGPRTLEGAIEADLTIASLSDGTLRFAGEIENATGIDFESAGLFFGGQGVSLGSFDSGDKIEAAGSKWETTSMGVGVPNAPGTGWRPWRVVAEDMAPSAGGDTDEEVALENANSLLQGMFNPTLTGRIFPPRNGKLLFVGIAQEADLTASIDIDRDFGNRLVLVVVELLPKLAPGPVVIPGNFIALSLQQYQKDLVFRIPSFSDDPGSTLELVQTAGVLALEFPTRSVDLVPTSLFGGPDATFDPEHQVFTYQAYNHDLGRFEPIPGALNTSSESPYLTPYSGRAFILLESRTPNDENGNPKRTSGETVIRRIAFGMAGRMDGAK